MNAAPKSAAMPLGRLGEDLAARYLEQNGYSILERNYRTDHKEIDLVATDGTFLVFFEVKTRSSLPSLDSRYGRPAAAVNKAKQQHLLAAARAYLREHPSQGLQPRMDVLEIYVKRSHTPHLPPEILKIHHIRNAFTASGG